MNGHRLAIIVAVITIAFAATLTVSLFSNRTSVSYAMSASRLLARRGS